MRIKCEKEHHSHTNKIILYKKEKLEEKKKKEKNKSSKSKEKEKDSKGKKIEENKRICYKAKQI